MVCWASGMLGKLQHAIEASNANIMRHHWPALSCCSRYHLCLWPNWNRKDPYNGWWQHSRASGLCRRKVHYPAPVFVQPITTAVPPRYKPQQNRAYSQGSKLPVLIAPCHHRVSSHVRLSTFLMLLRTQVEPTGWSVPPSLRSTMKVQYSSASVPAQVDVTLTAENVQTPPCSPYACLHPHLLACRHCLTPSLPYRGELQLLTMPLPPYQPAAAGPGMAVQAVSKVGAGCCRHASTVFPCLCWLTLPHMGLLITITTKLLLGAAEGS
jgi:hypothetical protein